MIKHLTPKSEAELAVVKLNERKEITKFAEKKLATYKKLPNEVNMDVRPSFHFSIYPIKKEKEQKTFKYWYFYNGMESFSRYYSLHLKKSKKNKWRTISIQYFEAEFHTRNLMKLNSPEN